MSTISPKDWIDVLSALLAPIIAKDWIDVLSALLTPTIAIAALAIGFLQWRINRNRLKNDLFDRRITLYEIITTYIVDCIRHSETTEHEEIKFLRDAKHARFIFNKEIALFVNEIYAKSIDLNLLCKEERRLQGDGLENVLKKEQAIRKWFLEELKNIEVRFEKFLKL